MISTLGTQISASIESYSTTTENKPILLYLPDMAMAPDAIIRNQLEHLMDFDVRALKDEGRTSLDDLSTLVTNCIEDEMLNTGKPTFIVGESFGGVLALLVALQEPKPPPGLKGVALLNPASSIALSWLGLAAPMFDSLAPLPARLVAAAISPLPALAALGATPEPFRVLSAPGRAQQLARFGAALPPETLSYRLASLRAAAAAVTEPKVLARLTLPVQLFVSPDDRLLPSVDEGRRLARDLPNAKLNLLPEKVGHAALSDPRVNLAVLLRDANFIRRAPANRIDYIGAFQRPTDAEIRNASASLDTIRRLASPVFMSKRSGGEIESGLGPLKTLLKPNTASAPPTAAAFASSSPSLSTALPAPVLFVGNHQLIGPDISLLVSEIYEQTGVLVRGLSHPSNFRVTGDRTTPRAEGRSKARDDVSAGRAHAGAPGADSSNGPAGVGNFNAKFGAVPVSPRALVRLMARGEAALLYPGGLREAFKSLKKGEAYRLFWPPAQDGSFARVAARYGATIVPVAAVGADEAFEMLLDADDLLSLPIVGDRVMETARRTPIALPGERFVTPVSLPAPWRFRRFYFLIGNPISTEGVDPDDREACVQLHACAKMEVEAGIAYLLERRREDPYDALLPRALVEASWDFERQVPSFPL